MAANVATTLGKEIEAVFKVMDELANDLRERGVDHHDRDEREVFEESADAIDAIYEPEIPREYQELQVCYAQVAPLTWQTIARRQYIVTRLDACVTTLEAVHNDAKAKALASRLREAIDTCEALEIPR